MAALLGGYQVIAVDWLGPESIGVTFRTDDASLDGRHWQLYVNRKLVAVSREPSQRRLIGLVPHSRRAAPLALVSCLASERNQRFGDLLGLHPWNRYRASWSVPESVPADLKHFDVCLSPGPDEDVDLANVVARVDYRPGQTNYFIDLPPFDEGTGEWAVAVVPRDRTLPAGNAGDPAEVLIQATVYPLDLQLRPDGNRFSVAVSGGVLTASFAYGVL